MSDDWTQNVQANVVCPSDELFGLSHRPSADSTRHHLFAPGENAHGHDELPAPGLLFLLADAVVGGACVRILARDEVIVTSSLHIELHARPWEAGATVHGGGAVAHRYHGGAAGSGLVHTGDLPVALLAGRFAVLPADLRAAGRVGSTPMTPEPVAPAPVAPAPVTPAPVTPAPVATPARAHPLLDSAILRTLGAQLVDVDDEQLTMSFVASPQLANERFGLHGGCGALMTERACDVLVRAVIDPATDFRPVTMSAAYFRPLAADGSEVRCTARIEHRGRRLMAVQAVLHTADGKPSVVFDLVAGGVARVAD